MDMSSPRIHAKRGISMDDFPTPYIRRVRYSDDFKELLESSYGDLNEEERAEWVTHQLNFPTVYVVRSSRETPGGLRFSEASWV